MCNFYFSFKSIHNRISLCKSKTAWQPFEGNVLGFVVGVEEEEHQNTGCDMKDLQCRVLHFNQAG